MAHEQLKKNIRIFRAGLDITTMTYGVEVQYDLSRFPGGEIHVRITGEEPHKYPSSIVDKLCHERGDSATGAAAYVYLANIRSAEDVMTLLLLHDAMRRMLTDGERDVLVIPYIPYGRQDRVCSQGEALSLKVFADLINGMGFAAVVSYDPHSLVTNALFERFIGMDLDKLLPEGVIPSPGYVVAPDAGAATRAGRIADKMGRPLLQALKIRHPDRVISVVYNSVPCEQSCLVVDDICDGGATFLALAEELRRAGAGKLSLLVTHGIFSNGLDALAERYERIYTVNNISGLEHPQLEVLG